MRVGYDPAYGARPLKRTIQKEVETALAAAAAGRQSPRRADGAGRFRPAARGVDSFRMTSRIRSSPGSGERIGDRGTRSLTSDSRIPAEE